MSGAQRKPLSITAAAALTHLDALHRLARHLTGDHANADDLVQETYARALGGAARFEAGTNVRAWLFRILRNTFIDLYRRARVNPVRASLDDDAPGATPAREPVRGDVELDLLRAVVARDIEKALASLDDDARTIVLLDHEGLTESELAEVLGCALGTVKSRLSRARATLRARLSDYAKGAP